MSAHENLSITILDQLVTLDSTEGPRLCKLLLLTVLEWLVLIEVYLHFLLAVIYLVLNTCLRHAQAFSFLPKFAGEIQIYVTALAVDIRSLSDHIHYSFVRLLSLQ